MRIDQMIRELRMQKRDLERAIELLETFERCSLEPHGYKAPYNGAIGLSQPGRRGRKFMSLSERRAVSERMKLYWSARKDEQNHTEAAQPTATTASKSPE
jgi:hypothetical protein